jgi:hypothetical protein
MNERQKRQAKNCNLYFLHIILGFVFVFAHIHTWAIREENKGNKKKENALVLIFTTIIDCYKMT